MRITDNLGTLYAIKIIEEGAIPRSPAQIHSKYELDFPFTVRRVAKGPKKTKQSCSCHAWTQEVGALLTFVGVGTGGIYSVKDTSCMHFRSAGIAAYSERFVLAHDKD